MRETRQAVARASRRAEVDVQRYRREPDALAVLSLGRFSDAGLRSLLLRHVLLALPLPMLLLAALASLLPGRLASRARAFLEEMAYWRAARRRLQPGEWRTLTHGPIILMYHAIGAPGEPASRYILPEPRFRQQMEWLRNRGYHLVRMREVAEARVEGRLLPPHSVAVTFDDGYRDNAVALARTRIPATIFVVTGGLGEANRWDEGGPLTGRSLLDWDEVRELAEVGVEIGAHTRTHPALPQVPGDRLEEEVCGSLDDLQRELGAPRFTFAYPHGRFDAHVQEAVAKAGFVGACCSRGGVNDPYVSQFELRRVEIKGSDSFLSFVLMVSLGRRITPLQLLRSLFVG